MSQTTAHTHFHRAGPDDPAHLRGLATVGGATLGMATGFGCLVLPSVVIVPIGMEFGWSRSDLSLCYTLAALGMAFGGLVWGRFSDRFGIRQLMWIGSAFLVLPLLIMAAANSLWQFYLANVLLGFAGFGCLYPPLVSAAGDWFEHRRGLVMGIVTAGGALGQGIMPFAADRLFAAIGWRNTFIVIAATLMVIQYLVSAMVRRRNSPAGPGGRSAGHSRFRLAASPRIALLSLAAFLCCACMGVPLIHLAGYVNSVCSGNNALGATSLLIAMTFGAMGRVCFGSLADRFGNLASYAGASFIQSICVLAFPMLQSELPLLMLSAVFGFGFAGNMTCLILCVRGEAPPAQFGGAIGLVMFVAWAGMGVGGYLGGMLFDFTNGYGLSFQIAAVLGALNLIVLAGLAMTGSRAALIVPAQGQAA